MGAPHGDPYSVSPLGCYLHSYHLLLAGYSSFYTRLFYPPDANYEKRKVISEEAKKREWMHFYCIRRVCFVEDSTNRTGGAFEDLVSGCNVVFTVVVCFDSETDVETNVETNIRNVSRNLV